MPTCRNMFMTGTTLTTGQTHARQRRRRDGQGAEALARATSGPRSATSIIEKILVHKSAATRRRGDGAARTGSGGTRWLMPRAASLTGRNASAAGPRAPAETAGPDVRAARAAQSRSDDPDRLEAQFLEHPARRRIVEEMRGLEPRQPQRRGRCRAARARPRWQTRGPRTGARPNSRARPRPMAAAPSPHEPSSRGSAVGPLEDQERGQQRGRAAGQGKPRRRAGGTATARSRGCGRSARRRSRRRAPGASSGPAGPEQQSCSPREHRPSPSRGPLAGLRDSFGRRQKFREERGLPSSPFRLRSWSGSRPGRPLVGTAPL